MQWPVTEPPDSRKLRWLPVAAVGVAGLAAVAAVAVCRRKAAEEPAPPEAPPPSPPPNPDLHRFAGGLWTVLPPEKPGSSREPRPPSMSPLSPLPPEAPKSRRARVILLSIIAFAVWLWVAVYLCEAMAAPTYERRPPSVYPLIR
jgi:hypothetical protein